MVSVRILSKVKQGKGPVHVEYKMNCFSNQELRFLVMNETVVDWCSDIFRDAWQKAFGRRPRNPFHIFWKCEQVLALRFFESNQKDWPNLSTTKFYNFLIELCWRLLGICLFDGPITINWNDCWETLITSISEERGPFCLFISPESFVVTLKIEALTLYWMTGLF